MRAVRIAGLVALACAGTAAASACGTFDAAPDPSPDLSDGGAIESGIESGTDSGATESGADTGAPACPPAGATPTTVASSRGVPSKLATDGENIYWLDGETDLTRASLATCATTKIATGIITSLAVDSLFIAWGKPTLNSLRVQNVTAAPAEHVALVDPSLIIAGKNAFWLDNGNGLVSECELPCVNTSVAALVAAPHLLAASTTRLFFFGRDPDGGVDTNLWWRPLGGTATSEIMGPLATQQMAKLLAANTGRVFWVTVGGELYGVFAGGGTPEKLATIPGATAIAADQGFVYVATSSSIMRVPAGGGSLTPIATNEMNPVSLVLTQDEIVWANGGDLRIRRMKKP